MHVRTYVPRYVGMYTKPQVCQCSANSDYVQIYVRTTYVCSRDVITTIHFYVALYRARHLKKLTMLNTGMYIRTYVDDVRTIVPKLSQPEGTIHVSVRLCNSYVRTYLYKEAMCV